MGFGVEAVGGGEDFGDFPLAGGGDDAGAVADDYRVSSEAPAQYDDKGVGSNLFAPLVSCSALPPVDTQPAPDK